MSEISNWKGTQLLSPIFENVFDNDELGYFYDCTSPPIYDEYLKDGDTCRNKEVVDESLHHNKMECFSIYISNVGANQIIYTISCLCLKVV